ncbi:Zinc finger protein 317 [Galemys pyrenaicus]|uniref:Zinc finger protein 317 n=1 Tax=Galemys pyrenaicus TaxID=202257 RepID=A0A8J6DTH8_GALPY|nr:Zinc finger protein 317 [Galemys pyrenaicus]
MSTQEPAYIQESESPLSAEDHSYPRDLGLCACSDLETRLLTSIGPQVQQALRALRAEQAPPKNVSSITWYQVGKPSLISHLEQEEESRTEERGLRPHTCPGTHQTDTCRCQHCRGVDPPPVPHGGVRECSLSDWDAPSRVKWSTLMEDIFGKEAASGGTVERTSLGEKSTEYAHLFETFSTGPHLAQQMEKHPGKRPYHRRDYGVVFKNSVSAGRGQVRHSPQVRRAPRPLFGMQSLLAFFTVGHVFRRPMRPATQHE